MHEYECGSLPPVHRKTYFEPTPKVGQRSAIEFSAKECEIPKDCTKSKWVTLPAATPTPRVYDKLNLASSNKNIVNAVASAVCASSTNDITPCPTPPKPEKVHETLRPNINVPPKTTVLNMDVSLKQGHLNYPNLLSYCNSSFPTHKLGTTGSESETYLCIYIYIYAYIIIYTYIKPGAKSDQTKFTCYESFHSLASKQSQIDRHSAHSTKDLPFSCVIGSCQWSGWWCPSPRWTLPPCNDQAAYTYTQGSVKADFGFISISSPWFHQQSLPRQSLDSACQGGLQPNLQVLLPVNG